MMVETRRTKTVPRQLSESLCRLLAFSPMPGKRLEKLAKAGGLQAFPYLALLRDTPQDPRSHPEGNVWVHTLHCLDALASCSEWRQLCEEDRLVTMLATLLHDLGKITNTRIDPQGRITSHGHAREGIPLARIFLEALGNQPEKRMARILPLVGEHMAFRGSAETLPINEPFVADLINRLEPANLSLAALVWYADAAGRPPRPKMLPKRACEILSIAGMDVAETPKPPKTMQIRDVVERFVARWQARLNQRWSLRPVAAAG